VAGLLAEHFSSLEAVQGASEDELVAIAGIGPEIAANVLQFFGEARNRQIVRDLLGKGVWFEEQATASDALAGKSFVFTGALVEFTRDEAGEEVQRRGGRVTSPVSRRTDYVVAGADAGSKRARAEELGVTILTEDEFRELLAAS